MRRLLPAPTARRPRPGAAGRGASAPSWSWPPPSPACGCAPAPTTWPATSSRDAPVPRHPAPGHLRSTWPPRGAAGRGRPRSTPRLAGRAARRLRGTASRVVTTEMVPEILPERSGEPAYLSVAGLPETDELVEIVDGPCPRPGTTRCRPTSARRTTWPRTYDGDPRRPAVVEVMLQVSASAELELPVGTWVTLASPSYQSVQRVPDLRCCTWWAPSGPPTPYPSPLDDIDTLREPSISILPELNLVRATALAADEETVLRATGTSRRTCAGPSTRLGHPRPRSRTLLVEEARRAELQAWPPVVAAAATGAATGVGEIAEAVVDQRRHQRRRWSTLTLTALAAGGAGGAARRRRGARRAPGVGDRRRPGAGRVGPAGWWRSGAARRCCWSSPGARAAVGVRRAVPAARPRVEDLLRGARGAACCALAHHGGPDRAASRGRRRAAAGGAPRRPAAGGGRPRRDGARSWCCSGARSPRTTR